jgi:tetratricopeptide (TPR) repeat protein
MKKKSRKPTARAAFTIEKGSLALTKNIMVRSAVFALALAVAPVAPLSASMKAAPAAGFAAQDNKDAQTDKRAQAAKKYLEAKRLEDSGNIPAAVAAYKEAVTLDPASVDLRLTLGSLYLKNRNTIDAEAQAREAMKIAADNAQVHKLLARVYLAQTFVGTTVVKDKARAAIAELEQVVKLDPAAKVEVGDKEMPAMTIVGELYWTVEEQDKALDAFKKVSEGNATSDEAHFQLASLYFQKRKYRDAAQIARKAYEINPKSPQYASLLAKSLLYIGRTQEALDIYKKAIGVKDTPAKNSKDSKDAKDTKDQGDDDDDVLHGNLALSPLIFEYAEALVYAGRYDEAISKLDPLLKLLRKESAPYLTAIRLKTDALKRAGKRDEAVRTLEEALKGQDVSDSLPLVYSLAETYEGNLQFDKAISIYEEALNSIINPDGTVSNNEQSKNSARIILQRIGLAYRLAGKRDKAMETFEKMKKVLGPDSPVADQLIIDTLINEGKYKEALEQATAAVAHFPDERGLKFQRAQAAGKLGDLQTADATLRGLLKQSSEDIDVYLYWSSVQLDANQLKEAEDSARKAMELDPKDIGPLITLSSIQERQKKFKDSETTLRRALEIDPDNATVLNNLGYFLADRNERLADAEALIRRAVNIEPTNGSFLDSLGWLLYRQNKLPEAQKYLELAVIYQARSATIHDHLGDLYKKIGQADKARAKWEDALKLATEPDEIKRIKDKLGKK